MGKAIQLVLTRPDPVTFKSWFKDMPELPPAVAWSAATMCGLLHGYKRLDIRFRGQFLQRELVTMLALGECTDGLPEMSWPSLSNIDLNWRRIDGWFELTWNGEVFARKTEQARGKWFSANFEDPVVIKEAASIATILKWPCFSQTVLVTDSPITLTGPGEVRLTNEPQRLLEVKGMYIWNCLQMRPLINC